MYTAYFDETGQQADGWIFVTGWFGNEDHWKAFVPKWKVWLGRRTKFHMHELRWKHPRTKKLLATLGPIPNSCGLRAAIGGVRLSDYQDLIKGSVVEMLSAGYIYCLFPLMNGLMQSLPGDERIELFFGPQDRFRETALKTLDFISKSSIGDPLYCTSTGISRLAKWSFTAPGDHSIMYHPADYLASALAHNKYDKQSQKAQWSRPIIDETNQADLVGAILEHDEIRAQIIRGRNLLDANGISFFPRSRT
jgi:hypothetical protein